MGSNPTPSALSVFILPGPGWFVAFCERGRWRGLGARRRPSLLPGSLAKATWAAAVASRGRQRSTVWFTSARRSRTSR